jgi:hypothetical protein
MLVNRQAGDNALVTAFIGHGVVPIQHCQVEFGTRFDTGDVFDTHNISQLLPRRPAPGTIRTQVPTLRDPQQLYELHKFVMSRHAVSGKPVLYEPGQALDYLAHFAFRMPYDRQVERGWSYYDQDGECYRPTLKGAYLMTWGLMQPFKKLRQIALSSRASKILREFEQSRAS